MKVCRFKGCNEQVGNSRLLLCNKHNDALMAVKRPSCSSVGNWFSNITNRAKERAEKKGIDFCITTQDIYDVWPKGGKCAVSGIKLDASKGYRNSSPALDRIDPTKGYVPGNIRLISGFVNNAKGDMPDGIFNDMLLEVSKFVVDNESKM